MLYKFISHYLFPGTKWEHFFNVLSNITFFGAESEHVSNDKQMLFAYGFQTFSENIISKYSSLLFICHASVASKADF